MTYEQRVYGGSHNVSSYWLRIVVIRTRHEGYRTVKMVKMTFWRFGWWHVVLARTVTNYTEYVMSVPIIRLARPRF